MHAKTMYLINCEKHDINLYNKCFDNSNSRVKCYTLNLNKNIDIHIYIRGLDIIYAKGYATKLSYKTYKSQMIYI